MTKKRRVLCNCCGQVVEGEIGSLGEWKPVIHREYDGIVCPGYFLQNGHRVEVLEERRG